MDPNLKKRLKKMGKLEEAEEQLEARSATDKDLDLSGDFAIVFDYTDQYGKYHIANYSCTAKAVTDDIWANDKQDFINLITKKNLKGTKTWYSK